MIFFMETQTSVFVMHKFLKAFLWYQEIVDCDILVYI